MSVSRFIVKLSVSPLPVLLGSFVKLRKAIINFVLYVSPHGTARLSLSGFFHEILCLRTF
jgi:hypothetical protein